MLPEGSRGYSQQAERELGWQKDERALLGNCCLGRMGDASSGEVWSWLKDGESF